MKENFKLEDITKKHPFIYEVGDKLYYIGQGVFKECIDHFSYTYFEKYKNCIKKIGSERIENNKITSDEIEEIIYCFRKVRNHSEFPQSAEELLQSKTSTKNFLASLSAEESAELEIQLKDHINIFKNYYHPTYPYN